MSEPVPEARPSSTIILARASQHAPEFLLVGRARTTAFGGAHVFPGGVVDADDRQEAASLPEALGKHADRVLGLDTAGAYYVAAVRELFEETGILLADEAASDALDHRQALLDGTTSWRRMLALTGIRPDYAGLRYVSFWVTPDSLPKRFSTRFFLAIYDGNLRAVPCGGETVDCRWLDARTALDAADRGDIILHPPTYMTMKMLATLPDTTTLADWAQTREARGVPCVYPGAPTITSVREALAGNGEPV